MSRKRWGRSLVDILRQLGVPLKDTDIERIREAKAANPDATTGDIVLDLDLASESAVNRALAIAKQEGSCDLFQDRVREARASIASASHASNQLERVASGIAKK